MDAATRAQVDAADPAQSAWLMANAGSGKTRVLTNRVAWLLLNGARPERILCLTFTKAAASEMQNRLFAQLGEWSMLADADVSARLAEMGVPTKDRDAARLRQARTLFARAIEAPGGLKIQTIHAFAASVLRRFPLEAGVSPGFQEIEDRAQVILMDTVLEAMADGADGAVVAGVAAFTNGNDLRGLMRAVLDRRAAFNGPMPDFDAHLGLPAGLTPENVLADTIIGGEQALCRRVVDRLDPEIDRQKSIADRLSSFPWNAPDLESLAILESVLLSGEKAKQPFTAKIGTFVNASVRAALSDDLASLEAFMSRVEAARARRVALLTADRSRALHRFARAFLLAYDAAKAARGWLDFSDLIRRARAVLTDQTIAPWVLYRLDGGIDHLLVDESQDTSPEQWEVMQALTEEFAAGKGARDDTARTLFIVGDVKQSIYSFQGADPSAFDRMRDHFRAQLNDSPAPLRQHELVYSFRSAPVILQLVDEVAAQSGRTGLGSDVRHAAFHPDLPGRIDIWPPVEAAEEKAAETAWYDPVDLVAPDDPVARMARQVGAFVAETLAAPPLIRDGAASRPADAGDILILVRKRGPLFFRIIEDIKSRDLPILGADRFEVTEQLAVKDLIALMRILATQADDLSLAAVLRSPMFGWDDDALFRLAHGRDGVLWAALPDGPTAEILQDLRKRAGHLRPYDLLERALGYWNLRPRMLARLGAEAEDGIDALLHQALVYERTEVPSLTGFLAWLEADELKVKRDAARATGQVRVMTVHGAKGLEAPIVVLPETGLHKGRAPAVNLVEPQGAPVMWPGPAAEVPEPLRQPLLDRKAADLAEQDRLLYVAMTRAAQWLVVGATGPVMRKDGNKETDTWFGAIESAATAIGATAHAMPGGQGWRLETGDWPQAVPTGAKEDRAPPLPDWATARAPHLATPAARAPSELGGAKAMPGDPGALDETAALRRGRLIHLLLEHLPELPPASWVGAAPGIVAMDGPQIPDAAEMAALLSEASGVLTAPDLKALFDGDALAELALTAQSSVLHCQLLGQIDRLVISEGHVLAVDFKSNARVPDSAAEVPEGLMRQMGAYADMLLALYPGHSIETAILWTKTARLMPLPHDAVMAALARATLP
ncbi:MAG: double-strand break repair helicase AddA [Pseudomonadota bacterium]